MVSKLSFELPCVRTDSDIIFKGKARVFTHKGEWLQGPVAVKINGEERYTIGVFSLLDDLNSAYVDVRRKSLPISKTKATTERPVVIVKPNGWNEGEVELVESAVQETWNSIGDGTPYEYTVFGYHDIRVGAGSGSSSALVLATIRATLVEHNADVNVGQISKIHERVESGADPLIKSLPEVVATRIEFGGPVRALGSRTPNLIGVTWSAGEPIRTSSVKFEYDEADLLLWRVRWAALERAVRFGNDKRVAQLATESARENDARNPKVDLALLEAAIETFGAVGFAVAHTGSYHTALFTTDAADDVLHEYKGFVLAESKGVDDQEIAIFNTADAAQHRYET